MEFQLTSWNCFGTAQNAFDSLTYIRAPFRKRFWHPEIIEELGRASVLCLQEIMSYDSVQFFNNLVKKYFPFAVRDSNRPKFLSLRGSGLGVGTQIKQTASRYLAFRTRGIGWDKWARKGALYTQLEHDGKKIDLMTVHLQAGYDANAARVRAAQLGELSGWIGDLGAAERPFIVCGDFNIQGQRELREKGEYSVFSAFLDGFDDLGAESDLVTYDPNPQGNPLAHAFERQGKSQRIDYIFMRPALRAVNLVCSGFHRIFDKPIESLGMGLAGWASDHYGLKATFEI